MARITFLGATGTVTGSKFLLEANARRLMIDCGLFQGPKELRLRNWDPLPESPASIDAVVLTHAHIDHTGYLPRLVRDGFRGSIFCNAATRDLCAILLPDSARLQEEDAAHAARKGYSKHKPPLPLYTEAEAQETLKRFQTIPARRDVELTPEFSVRLVDAGHILGSSMVQVSIHEKGRATTVLFSGDIGRYNQPILRDPSVPPGPCDYLICESTYGDRDHPAGSPYDALAEVIARVSRRGGAVVIPAFAVGRTQLLMHVLRELEDWDRIPQLPVFLDSPMATSVTDIYLKHREEHDLNFRRESAAGADPLNCHKVKMTRSVEESKAINRMSEPCIILSASGMATGGRVLHHLARRLPDSRNAVLLPGFQAQGTRGRALAEGAHTLRIHGEDVPVVAEVITLNQFSAHADRGEILRWLKTFPSPPRETFLVHGEPDAARALRGRIADELRWRATVPEYRQSFEL
ncbi:MAG TPA: MBL fold metallo-hydrolase [Candidatus Acidoferrales bacterium]